MSENLVKLISSGLKILLMILGVVYGFLIMYNGGYAEKLKPSELAIPEGTIEENIAEFEKKAASAPNDELKASYTASADHLKGGITLNGYVGTSLNITYIVMAIAFGFVVLFAVALLLLNLKSSVRTLAGIAVFALICFIAYSISSGDVPASWSLKDPEAFNAGTSFWADAALNLVYITGIIAVVSIITGVIWSTIKRYA